jgi:flavin-dependent thymidylate synthase
MDAVQAMSQDELSAELSYMAGTIPSSWEFVDLTFLLSGVTRACAQQITRTRTGSYAMQSQRVTDVSSAAVTNTIDEVASPLEADVFGGMAAEAMDNYTRLLNMGVPNQDARGILPMNVQCNLVAKYNLRSFVELVNARKSLRAQGEYADLADQMERAVTKVWPWARPFFESKHDKAIQMLESVARSLEVTAGKGHAWNIAKAIDLLRKG